MTALLAYLLAFFHAPFAPEGRLDDVSTRAGRPDTTARTDGDQGQSRPWAGFDGFLDISNGF